MMKPETLSPVRFTLIHCVFWWIMIVVAKGGAPFHGDMAEVYAWSQHWLMGSDKHPQFLPWMAKLWFMVAPKTIASFYLLSAVNLAVGMLGIVALGKALKFERFPLLVAMALCALAFPYLTLADKLNMNTICLSTWPWLAWAFVKTADRTVKHRLLYAVLFGVFATAAMLSKYYTIVLLAPLLALSLTRENRWLWATPAPYVAFAVFVITLAPHALWLIDHSGAVKYAEDQRATSDLGSKISHLVQFAIVPLSYWPVPIILAAILFVSGGPAKRIVQVFRFPVSGKALVFMSVGPLLLTLIIGATGFAELGVPWAIPIGFAFTLYLVANADRQLLETNGPKFINAFRFIWPIMIIGALLFRVANVLVGDMDLPAEPFPQAANAVVQNWEREHDSPLRWISKGNHAGQIAFFAPEPIEALPETPDRLPSYYPALEDWRNVNGVIFCSLSQQGQIDQACMDEAVAWAKSVDMQAIPETFSVQADTMFGKAAPFDFSVVYVAPR
ncbi:glycosyltransferase family 39 protein [Martelella mediterranea]|uniref:Dolichyl-phosphate-mannose-protein mannosyltransferase n=1 Tax=Martelella mediterranea TaxID=293089 RepID=A0A4R3NJJ2_9HYPH|nr:glycosyltransferase family 39 protein [Martelella mediterranea]TCT29238.1 dolichyl-phosphate-mannose-protein mannosyltransferase [Martelella mediterranea]